MNNNIVKCPICGTEFDWNLDDCPLCDWTYLGYEKEMGPDEKDSANPVTISQAKFNFSKGLNIWGDPLSKK